MVEKDEPTTAPFLRSSSVVEIPNRASAPSASHAPEVTQETIHSDYRDVDGVQSPRRLVIIQDGKRYVSLEITSAEYSERYDDGIFVKP